MLLIRNGYMIDPKSGLEGKYDLLIDEDRIKKIGKQLTPPCENSGKRRLHLSHNDGKYEAPYRQ